MLKQLSLSILFLSLASNSVFAADSGVNGKWSIVQEGNEGCPTKLEVTCSATQVHILISSSQSVSDDGGATQTEMESDVLAAAVGSKTIGYHTTTAASDATSCMRSESETDSYLGGGEVTLRTTDSVKLAQNGSLIYTHQVYTLEDPNEVALSCVYQRELN